MKIVLLAIVVFLASASMLLAHPFKLDSYGCHNNGALNIYECHTGQFAGKSWPNPGGQTKMLVEKNTPPPTPPAPPVSSVMGTATLTWTANAASDNVIGYSLYWAVEPDKWQAPIKLGNVTQVELSNILKGATYYFAITAYNSVGESVKSNTVSKAFNP